MSIYALLDRLDQAFEAEQFADTFAMLVVALLVITVVSYLVKRKYDVKA